jgi:phage-related protein
MPTVGVGVNELRVRDGGAFRVIYLAKIRNRIHILHCFEKKSAKTGKNALAIAKARLRQVLARLAEER